MQSFGKWLLMPLRKIVNMKLSDWNGLCAIIGAWLFTDSLSHFLGLVLILESIIATLEPCWNADLRKREDI